MKPLNPCELEIDLFCKGIILDTSCNLEKDARIFARTRAGLGSGLELVIPGDLKDIWVNVPVEEDFVQASPYRLVKTESGYIVKDTRYHYEYPVKIPPTPSWYLKKTSQGTPMARIGVLQGTYLGIYIGDTCKFWNPKQYMNCKFCTTGLNVGVNERLQKDIDEVVEVAQTAKEESGITFVHFNSGWQGGKGLDLALPYVEAIHKRVGAFVGVQVIPAPKKDYHKYDRLIEAGCQHFSFCYEFHNPEYFKRYLPGKQTLVGQDTFFDAMEYTATKLGKGKVSGEIIAGVEPLEDTLRAIEYITSVGAFPTVCIFRPVIGSDMEDYPSPTYEDMRIVFEHVYHCMRKYRLPMGIVPNIEVSLVVQPDDTRYLASRDMRWRAYELYLKALRWIGKPYIRQVLKSPEVKTAA